MEQLQQQRRLYSTFLKPRFEKICQIESAGRRTVSAATIWISSFGKNIEH